MASKDFSRVIVEQVNKLKIQVINDFAIGEYIANKTFFELLSDMQADIIDDGIVTTTTGQTMDVNTVGGALALQIYMETLNTSQQAMLGLAKLGLNVEKQVWKNI
jgi:hypothetical protein